MALLDRMEVIEFPGYIEEEKLEIARRFLLPRQMEENGLQVDELHIPDETVQRLIREYTYEAGVRNLEREIGRICRKIARSKAEHRKYPSVVIRTAERHFGPPQFLGGSERQTRLAWQPPSLD
jgi:ATP-dependent Lon protease